MRVLYLLYGYPQASQTYIKTELEALQDDYDIRIISTHQPKVSSPYRNHLPFQHLSDPGAMREVVEDFHPHVLHGHHLREIHALSPLAQQTNVPFTIRTHSFDVLERIKREQMLTKVFGRLASRSAPQKVRDAAAMVRDDLCLGILAFPFVRRSLESAGIPSEKIHDCWPVVNYDRFYDTSPNGEAIMNCGACIPKKAMDDYIRLGAKMPQRNFNLYAIGYKSDELVAFNQSMGNPVNIVQQVEPDDMRPEYKKHEWLVYTASKQIGTVGWPMAVAEAQAAGVGVCMQNIRPDLKEYVGPAGFLFDTIDDAMEIIARPFPGELREIGFEHAKKSDITGHLTLLTSLWERALERAV